jgi:uncharacterized LabA/DUF88 family protein
MPSSVAIFVDGGNLFYAQKQQGWHIDWAAVYTHFSAGKQVYGAFYFTATPAAGNQLAVEKYRKFRTALIYMGYNVIDKEVHVIKDPATGQVKLKGNLDIELVFRMLSSQHGWDEAVLIGLDIDYVPIINHLRNLGKTVVCVGRRQMTSLEVINAASKFIDLEELKRLFEKK